ncbi:hypothetical protein FN846DRAFT_978979 [Sphaerosporella brunnea]|uniref:Uncharacterized protein n=1 Tax=Sphaerosporella brunnea TaxID=1250544 RepID=A0A5J5EDZ1_9PEZI|nr:hypothetical protein FN846DRAFT_978979 [Sphaerosporella brunnea]
MRWTAQKSCPLAATIVPAASSLLATGKGTIEVGMKEKRRRNRARIVMASDYARSEDVTLSSVSSQSSSLSSSCGGGPLRRTTAKNFSFHLLKALRNLRTIMTGPPAHPSLDAAETLRPKGEDCNGTRLCQIGGRDTLISVLPVFFVIFIVRERIPPQNHGQKLLGPPAERTSEPLFLPVSIAVGAPVQY